MEKATGRERRLTIGGRRRLGVAIAMLAFLVLTAVACSSGTSDDPPATTVAPEDLPQPDPVAITLAATLAGDQVMLSGTATVPDGAKVSYELRHPSLTDPAVCQVAGVSCLAVGAVPVAAGQWSATVDMTGWPAGTVSVWAGFQMDIGMEEGQPTEIIELYGENGERITGESVIQVGEERHAEARTSIDLP